MLGFGFVLLVLQSILHRTTDLFMVGDYAFTPQLTLPIVIFLGVAADVHLLRGAIIAFFIGYLVDSFTALPMSLHTFLTVATFLIARAARLRLFLRGPLFQAALTFVASLIFGAATIALRAVFEQEPPFAIDYGGERFVRTLTTATATAFTAPLVFAVVQWIEEQAPGSHKREESAAW